MHLEPTVPGPAKMAWLAANDIRETATAPVATEWNLLLAAGSRGSSETHPWPLAPKKAPIGRSCFASRNITATSRCCIRTWVPLPDAVPVACAGFTASAHERNIHKSLFLARELIRILDCVGIRGVEAIPYKGVVMSELYYGDIALRQSGDIDLFVRKQDVMRIKRAVHDLGYTPRVSIPADAEQDYIASGYECTFDGPAGKNLLELQWALQPRFYAVDFDMNALFERSKNVTVAGRVMKTPSPEDLLLILSVHAAKHVWGRLIWLCDIAQILQRENLNWDWIRSQAAESWHRTNSAYHAAIAEPPSLEPAIPPESKRYSEDQLREGVRRTHRDRGCSRSHLRRATIIVLPSDDAAPRTPHRPIAIPHAFNFYSRSRRVGNYSPAEDVVPALPHGAAGATGMLAFEGMQ